MTMITTVELITPEKAREYLKKNTKNRTIRSRHVDELMRDMKSGKFKLTHQGIAFDDDGVLIDGQHRLTAIALSGIPVQMMVTRGMNEDTRLVIDTHSARNLRDFYCLSEKYENDKIYRNSGVIAAVRAIVRCGYNGSMKLSHSEIEQLMTGLYEHLSSLYNICCTRGTNVTGPVAAAILSALLSGEDKAGLHKFVTVFLTGNLTGCEEYDVGSAFKLSTAIMSSKSKGARINAEKMYNLSQNAIWHFLRGDNVQKLLASQTPRYVVDKQIFGILNGKTNA